MQKEVELDRTPLGGDKLFQVRARSALPLLVRQAEVAQPVVYGDLAEELGIPNPRNFDYVLGAVGRTMSSK